MAWCSPEIRRADQCGSRRFTIFADVRLLVILPRRIRSNRLGSYDRFLIRTIVILAYLGWAAYAAIFVFRPQEVMSSKTPRGQYLTAILTSVMLLSWAIFAVQKSPWTFYVYVAFPCYFWHQVILHAMRPLQILVKERRFGSYGKSLIQAILVIGILQSMVVCIHELHCLSPPQYKF
jgi:hypothetical protein